MSGGSPVGAARATPKRKTSLRHRISVGLSCALLTTVLMLGAILIVIPKAAGATPLTVLTSSMEPSLPPGTLIFVKAVELDQIAIGDVVTYQIASGNPDAITHRVVGITSTASGERSLVLQGDNNGAADAEPVIGEQVQGRLWYSVPYAGFINASLGGETRSWLVPTVAAVLLSYATVMVATGLTGTPKRGRRRAPGGRLRRFRRARPAKGPRVARQGFQRLM